MDRLQHPLPARPSLVAVLLVTRSRAGPRFVLHYPAFPSSTCSRNRNLHAEDTDNSSNAESEDSSEDGSEEPTENIGSVKKCSSKDIPPNQTHHENIHDRKSQDGPAGTQDDNENGISRRTQKDQRQNEFDRFEAHKQDANWSSLFGMSKDGLAKMLAPSTRFWHRRKFELCLENLHFLGYPVFCDESADKETAQEQSKDFTTVHDVEQARDHEIATDTSIPIDMDHSKSTGKAMATAVPTSTSLGSTLSQQSNDSESSPQNKLTMFHVVFVMSTTQLEHHIRIDEMYDHIAKPLAKVLHERQSVDRYVETEAKRIEKVINDEKESGSHYASIWPALLKASTLARAIATTFDKISTSEIAHLTFGKDASMLSIALQIPQAITTPTAPNPNYPQTIPGLSLSTANLTACGLYFDGLGIESTEPSEISEHAAVLLLVSPVTLLREFSSVINPPAPPFNSPKLASAMQYYLRHWTPRKSLAQLSRAMRSLTLKDMQLIARHLIRLRKARAIAPLHASNTYIVSPNADMQNLAQASAKFGRHFTAVPNLLDFLSKLRVSSSSRLSSAGMLPPWGALIPSKDHKDTYMDILAWLVKAGLVCQLRTYAWIRVSADVKRKVSRIREEDRRHDDDLYPFESDTFDESVSMGGTTSPDTSPRLEAHIPPMGLLSERLAAQLNLPRPTSEAGSTTSANTAIKMPSHVLETPPRSTVMSDGPRLDNRDEIVSELDRSESTKYEFESSLIASPRNASPLESLWIEHIGSSLTDPDVRRYWPKLVKYFDGRHAIEEIATMEGWKRKAVAPCLMKLLSDREVLTTVRHW